MERLSDPAKEVVERIWAIHSFLRDEAAEAESLRRPTDVSIEKIRETGLFRAMVPRRFGGLELDLDLLLEAGLALGQADVSIAWVSTFYVEHNWMLCQFPEEFQESLYQGRAPDVARAVGARGGPARRAPGGFLLDGRWSWGSGVMHGEWVLVGALVEGETGEGVLRFCALPIEDVEVDDVWHMAGMSGTGSNDIVVRKVFVPADRTVSIPAMGEGRAPGARIHEGLLYRTPMIPILMTAASTPIVGQARAVVEAFRKRLSERTRLFSSTTQAESPAMQQRLASATIEIGQVESLLRELVADVMERRDSASVEDRARWSSSFAHAVHRARAIIAEIALASGGSAHFRSEPLQRAQRDVNVAACHVAFDYDGQSELYGRVLLGLPPLGAIF
jgi:3-hydroxy-9,10-secoandrosta-1,3,5(10)-triene-9,17-dione monooxygenase